MIKFFRTIRKQLLGEGNAGRYFKYAIGEVLLVVIGILIALQINNWNLERKNNQLKENYLTRLVNDIAQDTSNINEVITNLDICQKAITHFTQAIHTSTEVKDLDSTISKYFELGWIIMDFVVTDNTYKDLSQTGNMNIIKNDTLVDDIIAYYGYVKIVENYHTINKNWITPMDLEVAKVTPAFELDPSTKILFEHKNRDEAIANIISHAALMERNAAGHYWINRSLSNNLTALKGVSITLLKALEAERSTLKN